VEREESIASVCDMAACRQRGKIALEWSESMRRTTVWLAEAMPRVILPASRFSRTRHERGLMLLSSGLPTTMPKVDDSCDGRCKRTGDGAEATEIAPTSKVESPSPGNRGLFCIDRG
jgi:hypothetical protein